MGQDLFPQPATRSGWNPDALLRGIFAHAAHGLALATADGRLIRVNRALARMVGRSEEELIALGLPRLVHPSEAMLASRALERLCEDGEPGRAEHRLLHQDGHHVWCAISRSLVHDEAGRHRLVLLQFHDLTRHQQAERAFQESEERFRIAFGHAAHGMALLNADSRFVQVNQALCDMLGHHEPELIGRHFSELTHPDDLARSYEHHRVLRQGDGRPVQWEARLVHREGGPVWTQHTLSLVRDGQGNPLYLIAQVQDISERQHEELERRRLEEQLRRSQRLDAVGRLAGGVAHDFNNMLAVILNNSDFVTQRLEDGHPARRYLAAIREAAERSAALTRQLMIFGRRDVATPQVLDLNQVLQAIEHLLHRTLGEDIELEVRQAPDLSPVWMALPHAEQVIMNLAVNARDAMPRGGRLVISTEAIELDAEAVRTRVGLAPGRYVRITVDDTGVGMSNEVAAHAFEPFFTTKGPGEGAGLGLSILYGIVEEAGGHVRIESAPGAGASFEILLPAAEASLPEGVEDVTAPRGKGERVLVVEDEPAVRELTVQILVENGYEVRSAEGGEEAVQLLANDNTTLDLLLTDVVMPRMSGSDLAAYVATLRPGTRVLFMSGHPDERLGRHRVRAREVAFLQKPFNARELLRTVRGVLDMPRPSVPSMAGHRET